MKTIKIIIEGGELELFTHFYYIINIYMYIVYFFFILTINMLMFPHRFFKHTHKQNREKKIRSNNEWQPQPQYPLAMLALNSVSQVVGIMLELNHVI